MSIRILKVAWFELEHHLCKKSVWCLTAIYTVFTALICMFPNLRQSYFSDIESVSIMLLNFIAPVFLAIILIGTLSSAFAGDTENNVNQIPAVCLTGRKGRSIAKMLAAIIFSALSCLMIALITFIVPFICGKFDRNMRIKYIGAEVELSPVWVSGTAFRIFICVPECSLHHIGFF